MIELNLWTTLLFVVGGIVVAIGLLIVVAAIYSHMTDEPIIFELGPLKVRINDFDE